MKTETDEEGVAQVIDALGIGADSLLGKGGEA